MARKIKVPAIWYNEQVKSYKGGIVQEPKHLRQLEVRLEAMLLNLITVHDANCKTAPQELESYILEAKGNLGKSKIALDNFVAKYEPCKELKPDYAGAEKYLIRNKSKINNCTDAKGNWDAYHQCTVIEEKFKLPCLTDRQMHKIFKLFDKLGIELY